MCLLELLHRLHRRSVPLPIRAAAKRAIFAERRLNFGNPVRRRRLLPALPRTGPLRRFSVMSACGVVLGSRRRGAGALFRRARRIALRQNPRPAYTHSASYQTRQRQTTGYKHLHSLKEKREANTPPFPIGYCWPSAAGTTPDKNTVNTRSLSCRRSTLNTTFCPGFSLLTAFR